MLVNGPRQRLMGGMIRKLSSNLSFRTNKIIMNSGFLCGDAGGPWDAHSYVENTRVKMPQSRCRVKTSPLNHDGDNISYDNFT